MDETVLILIRHGESVSNSKNIFAGQLDVELTQRGYRQAELTAKYISENYKVDVIYASDLKRAYNTAKVLGDLIGIEVIKSEKLREIDAGKWEGILLDDVIETYRDDYDVWLNHIGKSRCTGGESVSELLDRIQKELTRIAKENTGKTVAIGTHATPIRVMESFIKTGGVLETEKIPWVSNASVSVFTYKDGEWNIKSRSKDEHLLEYRTFLPPNV